MWIFDSYYKGSMQLWGRERGLIQASAAYPLSFYMHLPDPPAHRDMIEALESRFKTEECSFKTIFGNLEGHRIYAGRKVAETIEIHPPLGPALQCGRPAGPTLLCRA
jgi:DNA polymerase I